MVFILLVLSYLLGSVSFGYLLARIVKGIDIRELGSGNPGATNIMRVMGLRYGLLVLFLDLLKGLVVAIAVSSLTPQTGVVLACGLAVIAGHNWPIFFKFKGGKGAATTLGFFLGFTFLPTLFVVAIVAVVFVTTRYVSLGSIVGSIMIPLYMLIISSLRPYFLFGLVVCFIILWRHRSNIERLLNGTEPRLGDKFNFPQKGR
ncbi:MAG: glycerol-3-phosphate 1-O-acyltransferase PlsY [Dethiobacteria bacterium]|jgi:glycerol-3-phosphate acyltransferase PlsY